MVSAKRTIFSPFTKEYRAQATDSGITYCVVRKMGKTIVVTRLTIDGANLLLIADKQ